MAVAPCFLLPTTVGLTCARTFDHSADRITVYAYQGAITAHLFNGRTRALVSLLTGLGAIVGAILIGVVLDRVPLSRRKRSMVGCLTVIVLNIVIWVGGLVFQVKFTRHSEHVVWDWSDGAAIGPIILLMSCTLSITFWREVVD